MKKIICHISSAHDRYDTRIFLKQAISLSRAGFNTNYIVIDGNDDESLKGVNIINANKKKRTLNRIEKIIMGPFLIYKKIKILNPEVVHFHDPELILFGIYLKLRKIKVIYDIHETTWAHLLQNNNIPKGLRWILSMFFKYFEKYLSRFFNALIFATKGIQDNFSKNSKCSEVINNYPLIGDLDNIGKNDKVYNEIIYLGGINSARGIESLIKSLELTNTKLNLIGDFTEKGLKEKLSKLKGWNQVIYHGFCSREKTSKIISRCFAGLVTYYDAPNYIKAQPNKLFEYMVCGLPVVSSNFELWKLIIEGNKCGVCVNPKNPKEIANTIEYLKKNKRKAKLMGNKGREAVINKYNWTLEEKKLLNLYKKILS